MHTFIKKKSAFHVGYWTPFDGDSSEWLTIAVVDAQDDAVILTNFLNGGPGHERLAQAYIAGRIKFFPD